MKKWVRDNGLSLTLFALFAVSIIGHAWSGWLADNQDRIAEDAVTLSFAAYLTSGAFLSSVFENWESEFLQMGFYVMLTAYLYQRGSPESKDPDKPAKQDRDPALDKDKPDAPWPVRAGGVARTLYAHSLGLALLLLFAVSFVLHWRGSTAHAVDEALRQGETPPTATEHLGSAQFWFESFQNWQSEFLSTGLLIVLAIVLREKGSPESKPVAAPNEKTGTDD
jgi:hypothetical protein